jgi:hypothetical protein
MNKAAKLTQRFQVIAWHGATAMFYVVDTRPQASASDRIVAKFTETEGDKANVRCAELNLMDRCGARLGYEPKSVGGR